MSGSFEEDSDRDIFDTEDDLEYESDIHILPQYAKEVSSALKGATPIREKSLNSSCDDTSTSKIVPGKCDPSGRGWLRETSVILLVAFMR